ncbi:MAG TPA: hypothetical protein VK828_05695 [Terriglobales bacterium]|jgi:DNA-binding beta-propeller fold protein YncE|nr:hypothetical protein [Terriglobales bacterium]
MKANLRSFVSYLLSASFTLAFAARPASPANQTDSPKQTDVAPANNTPSAFNINVENWVKPERGWLYVLDPKPDAPANGGRIWLLDPETGKTMGSIRTGNNADFALSPDGFRLYVASIIEGDSSELAVIDTSRGAVLQRATVDDREVGNVIPSFSVMAVSGDGSALRILLDTPKSEDRDSFLFATFNTETGTFLRRTVHLGNCGPGRFISYPSASQFDVLCPRTNRIRLIRVDADSRELQNLDVVLPWERRIGAAHAIEPTGAEEIAIVRGDGGIFQMNIATQQFTETSTHPALPNRIPPAVWPISPDGSRIYLGYNSEYNHSYDNRFYLDYGRPPNLRPDDATASEFRVLDTRTWRKIGTIKTKTPFWSAVVTNDGKVLYAMAPHKHSILVIDTVKMHQSRTLKIGGAPALALVAP